VEINIQTHDRFFVAMNILFVTPPPYLPNKLHRIRSYNLIHMLSKKNNIYVLSTTTQKIQQDDIKSLRKNCKEVIHIPMSKVQGLINCLLHPHLPYEVAFCINNNTKSTIAKIIKRKKIDLIYFKRLRSAVYADKKINTPCLIDTTDAMSLFYKKLSEKSSGLRKLFYFLESKKYFRYEKHVANKIRDWVVCSEYDKEYLQTFLQVSLTTIPNSVEIPKRFPRKTNMTLALLFQGLMDKPVNRDAITYFVKDIFPSLTKKHPNVRLFIVGPRPPKSIKNLMNKHIKVLGYVNDINVIYKQTTIVICPIRIGTGTRNKILQAWARRKPVVSTSIGAEGLQYTNKKDIVIADTPKEFAKAIIDIVTHESLQKRLQQNGFKTAEKYYSQHVIQKKLDRLL